MWPRGEAGDRWGRYLLLVLGGVSYFCLLFVWFSLPAYLSPIGDDLGLSDTQAGIVVGAIPATYIPLALVTGVVVDRIGPRWGIGIAIVLFGSGQALRSTATGFPTLLGWTILMGVGATGITFGLPKLVADLFPPDRVGTASSVYLVGSYLGTATVFAVGRPILGPALGGWRRLFLASGLAVLLYAAVWGVVAAWSGRRSVAAPDAGDDSDPAFTPGSIRADVAAVVAHREMLLLVAIGTMYLFVAHGLQGWLVTIFEAGGASVTVAGTVTSLFVVGQIAGVLSIPPLADRWDRRRAAVVACGVLCLLGPLGLLLVAGAGWRATVPVAVVGIGIGGLSPLVRALPVELDGIGPGLTATAVGLVFAVGEIGGFLGPFLVGALRDLTGSFVPGIALFSVGGAIVVAAGLAMEL